MTSSSERRHPGDDDTAREAVRLTRGVTATWWYTFVGIVFFETVLVFVWSTWLLERGYSLGIVSTVGIGGLVWVVSTVPLLLDYRNMAELTTKVRRRRAIAPLAVAVLYGIVAGALSVSWVLTVVPLLASIALLPWPPGVRYRLTIAGMILVAALWFVDSRGALSPEAASSSRLVGFFSVLILPMTVVSVWWWDVLIRLDRARAAEGRLAATQERLRVATDVHDLQGHHLQVIALQLELAERLLATDSAAALDQLRAARTSVDEARQGTRDLATRFRSAPLSVELANAVDLLRAAGTSAEASSAPDVDAAPGDVFGAVIRETTTNALRHGGGEWVRMSLARSGSSWRFEIANDAGGPDAGSSNAGASDGGSAADDAGGIGRAGGGSGGGSGLEGLGRRAAEVGGSIDVQRAKQSFTVVVTVPAEPVDAR